MRQAGFVGHVSPTTGRPADRLERAGFRTHRVLENVARGYDARGIHRGLMGSPGHRAAILDQHVTTLGIGVVAEPEGGRSAFLVTELFVQEAALLGARALAAAPGRILEAHNAARGTRLLRESSRLEALAARAAARIFEEPTREVDAILDETLNGGPSLARELASQQVIFVAVGSVEAAFALTDVLTTSATIVGIGVAQGNRPDQPPNSVAVVVLLGWPR